MKTIAFTGERLFMKFEGLSYFRAKAQEAGYAVVEARAESDEAFIEQVRDVNAIALIARRLDARVISELRACELIQTLSVGYDCVDVTAATNAGIPVCNTPAYCTDEVATHAITLLVCLARKIHVAIPATRDGQWDYNYTRPIQSLREKRLGIVGLGRVGRALLPKAGGFGMRVQAYDPYLDDDLFALLGVERCYELGDLLRTADYVSIHAPLTAETRGMIGAAELSLMRSSAFLVNTARGPLWDEQAVVQALRREQIAGAATDVLVTEPIEADHPFLSLPNMIVTPHMAWYSEESFHKNMVDAMDEIVRVLSGGRPRAIVNSEIFSRR